jgi:hypothetical protein
MSWHPKQEDLYLDMNYEWASGVIVIQYICCMSTMRLIWGAMSLCPLVQHPLSFHLLLSLCPT